MKLEDIKDPKQRHLFAEAMARSGRVTPAVFDRIIAPVAPVMVKATVQPSTDEAKLNKLESSWLAELRRRGVPVIHVQSMTLKLAHDCRYTPDFAIVTAEGQVEFHETKGPQFWDDARVKLKVAARLFPWARFLLIRWDKETGWLIEEVKR